MATLKLGSGAVSQLNTGASILAAARTVDTRVIKVRLADFQRAQLNYNAAHEKVRAAEANLRAAQTRLEELDANQDQAVDGVARMLIVDGQPRANPFAAFGLPAPGRLSGLAVTEETKVIHQLVAAVQRAKNLSKSTQQAAQAADKAAHAVEQALAQIDKLQGAVREARHTRAAVAQTWKTVFGALKRGARAAADDGAPNLYATLFDRPTRPNGKNGKRTKAPTPDPMPASPPPPATPA